MGKLIDGVWTLEDQITDSDGSYRRAESSFRNWVTADGAPGPSGEGGFEAEPARYHLYIAIGCPWAHRTWLMRRLKGLDDVISLSKVANARTEAGWVFDNDDPEFADPILGKNALYEIYTAADPACTGRATVPILYDKKRATIVNNESSEIILMLNGAFDSFTTVKTDYYPAALREEIDTINERVFQTVNNGVYRCGFAQSQEAYDAAFDELFETLDWLEALLAERRYIAGDVLTIADLRLFPTLVRFDVAYHGAFKCNLRKLSDYPNLWDYTRALYHVPGVAETVHPDVYKRGYYSLSEQRNPTGIVPRGPIVDFTEPARGAAA